MGPGSLPPSPTARRDGRALRAEPSDRRTALRRRRFTAHRDMRATLLAQANTPLTLARRILRHSAPDLTANHYTLYELEQKSEALARVPSLAPDATGRDKSAAKEADRNAEAGADNAAG